MASFADLKKNRNSLMDKINKELVKDEKGNSYDDERMWKLTRDKSGNGFATLRFLPAPPEEEIPWVKLYSHGFKGPTGLWYIENSRTTINEKDPCSEYNTSLWNNGTEQGKEQARVQKRRLSYISNVYIVSDPSNPANEGKVMLYKYGKRVFDKLSEAMNPAFEDETPFNPFDLWQGANFKLKVRIVDGWPNYDKSEFDPQAPLFEDDDELEATWNKEHSLNEMLAPENFKPYETLKEKLDKVMGLNGSANRINLTEKGTNAAGFGEGFDGGTDDEETTDDVAPPTEGPRDHLSYFKGLADEVV